jgi:hypothetical protein
MSYWVSIEGVLPISARPRAATEEEEIVGAGRGDDPGRGRRGRGVTQFANFLSGRDIRNATTGVFGPGPTP